ncbi:hypothetical protein ABEB36_002277 [Hypothenemus hampei]|uniref:Uncharacterized protein n=1 Tax=Hypothenemus hampei TaxID=57062 RepID=A0ABD1F8B0_HYPHA
MNNSPEIKFLETLNLANVNLRKLNPNVIRAWFDTDCELTKHILNFLSTSITRENILSPLELAEFQTIENPKSTVECDKQLKKINKDYLDIIEGNHEQEIQLLQRQIEQLEDENDELENLLDFYKSVDTNISSDLNRKTEEEIRTLVECKKLQEDCEDLGVKLGDQDKTLRDILMKYNPEMYFVNFINLENGRKDLAKLNEFLSLYLENNEMGIECSSADLEDYQKRIFNAQQKLFAIKVETYAQNKLLEYLNNLSVRQETLNDNSTTKVNSIKMQQLRKKDLCDKLDEIALEFAQRHTRNFAEEELKEYRKQLKHVEIILEQMSDLLSYNLLITYFQSQEQQDLKNVKTFYAKILNYVENDLQKCYTRNENMQQVFQQYQASLSNNQQPKFVHLLIRILCNENMDIKSAAEVIGAFKAELYYLENTLFSLNVKTDCDLDKFAKFTDNIKILQQFLSSGPTTRICLIPMEIQEMFLKVENCVNNQRKSIDQAVQVPQAIKKSLGESRNLARTLMITFLVNPSGLDVIFRKAKKSTGMN